MMDASRSVTIRPLAEHELDAARLICRRAFGTFIGLPDPLAFGGDTDFIGPRWRIEPRNSFAAEVTDAEGHAALAGSNFVTRWGSFGFFGPLSVAPEHWDLGLGRRLVAAASERMDGWGLPQRALFTFSNSPKHLELYRKFGYWPRFLVAILDWPLPAEPAGGGGEWSAFSRLAPAERERALAAARGFAGNLLEGLDLTEEIVNIERHGLGETVLLWDGGELAGLAAMHIGLGSEAGSGAMYARLIAARPGREDDFERLLRACAACGRARGAVKMIAGVELECERAYARMRELGAGIFTLGLGMHYRNDPGYMRRDAFVLCDWR